MIVIWLTLTFVTTHAATLFIDLNDAPKEISACMDAIGEENVFVVTKGSDRNGRDVRVTRARVESQVEAMERAGIPCDKIIFSGHQGSGHIMGENGDLYANDIHQILEKHQRTKASVRTMGFVSCYAANVHASQNFFLHPNSNINQTVGFPIQSSTKENPDSAKMVGEYCKHGQEWAKKVTKQELCDIYPGFAKLIPNQQVAICSREAIASHAYGKDLCYDYDELKKRCDDFDPGDAKIEMYEKYMAADDPCQPGFENPPVDKNSQYEAGGSPLRKFYSQVHLWRQCAENFKASRARANPRADQEANYVMPEPRKLIRLIKFDELKTNIASLNAAEIKDYDSRLSDLCLDKFKLGDMANLNRAEIVHRINGASAALNQAIDLGDGRVTALVPEDDAMAAELALTRTPASTFIPDDDDDNVPRVREAAPRAPAPAVRVSAPPATPAAPVARPRVVAPPVAAPGPQTLPSVRTTPPASVQRKSVESAPPPAPVPAPKPRSEPPRAAPIIPPPPSVAAPASASRQCGNPAPRPPPVCRHTSTSPEVVEKMNSMLKWTLVDLNNAIGTDSKKTYRNCSHFHLIEPNAPKRYKSQCIIGYGQAEKLL